MEPLEIRCCLGGPVMLSRGPVALDALLAWAQAQVEGRDAITLDEMREQGPIEIPVEREPQGRFHLASLLIGEPEAQEGRWINRRFPLEEAQERGAEKLKRITLATGATKSFRIPASVTWMKDDLLTAWCVGDRSGVEDLLGWVGFVGKKRSVGCGKVRAWEVEPCEPWEGFPLVRDGEPLRPLPQDWPGLGPGSLALRAMTYPYFDALREEPARVAEWMI